MKDGCRRRRRCALVLEDGQREGADLALVERARGGDAHAELECSSALARVVRRALRLAHGGGELGVPPVRGAQDVQEGADGRWGHRAGGGRHGVEGEKGRRVGFRGGRGYMCVARTACGAGGEARVELAKLQNMRLYGAQESWTHKTEKASISATKRKKPIADSIVAQWEMNKAAVPCIPQEVIAFFGIAFVLRSGIPAPST